MASSPHPKDAFLHPDEHVRTGSTDSIPGDSSPIGGEYRLFYLSPFALQVERDILKRRHEENLAALLMEAELILRANQELWRRVDRESALPGLVLRGVSATVDRVRDLLTDAADLCGHWEEVKIAQTGTAADKRGGE